MNNPPAPTKGPMTFCLFRPLPSNGRLPALQRASVYRASSVSLLTTERHFTMLRDVRCINSIVLSSISVAFNTNTPQRVTQTLGVSDVLVPSVCVIRSQRVTYFLAESDALCRRKCHTLSKKVPYFTSKSAILYIKNGLFLIDFD